MAGPEKLW